MSRKQQIIAMHDALPAERSPMDAVRAAITSLSEGPPPAFIAIDVIRPYPMGDLGPPDWLIVAAGGDDPTPGHADWRRVVDAAPPETFVVLLSHGHPPEIPRHVLQHVNLTGWHGDRSDPRLHAIARRVAAGASAWRTDDVESDAIRRGALVHVGDGTTMLNPKLLYRIAELDLSKATKRVIWQQNIMFVGDLIQMSEAEILRIPEMGRKRLNEIKGALKGLGLSVGAVIPGWPPDDIETALARGDVAVTLARTPQAPSGEMFSGDGERLSIDPAAGDQSDREFGSSNLSIQLQNDVTRKLETLSQIAARLGNQPGWQDLAPLCRRLEQLLDRPGAEIADVLGSLYGAALELGSFAEMDAAAQRDPRLTVAPLEPSAARPLQDVLSSMAPWLRRFPTVRELDDEAGRFLVAQSSTQASRAAFAAAAATELLDGPDAALLRALLDAGDRGGFLGGKAARRGVLSARNLVLAAATVVVGGLWDGAISEYAGHSVVARRAGAMLVSAENEVLEIAAEMPADVRTAIRQIMGRTRPPEPPPSKTRGN